MRITLTCTAGSVAGRKFEFNEPLISIGRGAPNMIALDEQKDVRVSLKHCEILEQNGKFLVRDMGSVNGTLVNGMPITAPTILRDGAILKLGDKGPEFIVGIQSPQGVLQTAQNTMQAPSNRSGPAPAYDGRNPQCQPAGALPASGKVLIGVNTFERKIGEVRAEVKKDQETKSRRSLFLIAGSLAVAVVAVVAVYLVLSGRITGFEQQLAANQKQLQELATGAVTNKDELLARLQSMGSVVEKQERSLAELNTKLDAEGNLTANDRAQRKKDIEAGQKALAEMRTTMDDFVKNNQAMFDQATAPFKQVMAQYASSVYSVGFAFEEQGQPQIKFVATAFAISPEAGLLVTNAHVTQRLQPLLSKAGYSVVVRCNSSPRFTYKATKVISHPDFERLKGSRACCDVGLLEVDLRVDGVTPLAFPSYVHPASNEELEAATSGQPVALVGFPGYATDKYEKADGSTNVAKLSTGVISSTLAFSGMPLSGRDFEILESTCVVYPGNSGSPLFAANGKVLAVINSGGMALAASGDHIPIGTSNCVNVRFVQALLRTFYPHITWK